LLHPEAGRRTIQQSKESQVIIDTCFGRQLDDGGMTIEYLLPKLIQDELIMGRDAGECD
jgi:hypothetical protein